MAASLGWGALAASSLVLGAWLALRREWPPRLVGYVLAFGAGALISAISFELALEGAQIGGLDTTAIGLGIGAVTYYLLDGALARRTSGARGHPGRATAASPGPALALGAFLDGVPEQLALGIGLAAGEGVSVGLLVAIFVSNLPEAIGSGSEMRKGGTHPRTIMRLWLAVAVICIVATVIGYAAADSTSGDVKAMIDGFAAGALIVMLIDSMIPDATGKAGTTAGLATTLGFAVAAALSTVS
jgi:zinc transporter, ZIP family